jgi:YD repeat-containing protein
VGDILKETIGSGTNVAAINNTYDTHTLRLTDQLVNRAVTTPASVDEEKYNYDPYGNITSQNSARLGSATVTETQCYQYDGLDQLTQAWTASDNCAATPAAAAHAMVTSGINPASAYWTSWSYDTTTQGNAASDVLGEIIQQVQHSLTSAQGITTANTFGGANGGPHALTLAATTGGATSNSSFGYDPAGNMTTRTTPAGGTQALSWNAAGQLAQVSGGTGGTTTYVYAPDGSLLLQENPGSSTLYLDGEQLTATTSGGTTTVTGARIIPLPSGGDVVRTGSGTSYSFEVPDPTAPTTSTSTPPPRHPPGGSSPPTAPPAAPPPPGPTTAASSTSPPTPPPASPTSAPAPTTPPPASSSPPTPSWTRPTRRTSTPTSTARATPSPTATRPACTCPSTPPPPWTLSTSSRTPTPSTAAAPATTAPPTPATTEARPTGQAPPVGTAPGSPACPQPCAPTPTPSTPPSTCPCSRL